jgi:hypothetical protein
MMRPSASSPRPGGPAAALLAPLEATGVGRDAFFGRVFFGGGGGAYSFPRRTFHFSAECEKQAHLVILEGAKRAAPTKV